jgi:hypothetical protein
MNRMALRRSRSKDKHAGTQGIPFRTQDAPFARRCNSGEFLRIPFSSSCQAVGLAMKLKRLSLLFTMHK